VEKSNWVMEQVKKSCRWQRSIIPSSMKWNNLDHLHHSQFEFCSSDPLEIKVRKTESNNTCPGVSPLPFTHHIPDIGQYTSYVNEYVYTRTLIMWSNYFPFFPSHSCNFQKLFPHQKTNSKPLGKIHKQTSHFLGSILKF